MLKCITIKPSKRMDFKNLDGLLTLKVISQICFIKRRIWKKQGRKNYLDRKRKIVNCNYTSISDIEIKSLYYTIKRNKNHFAKARF